MAETVHQVESFNCVFRNVEESPFQLCPFKQLYKLDQEKILFLSVLLFAKKIRKIYPRLVENLVLIYVFIIYIYRSPEKGFKL